VMTLIKTLHVERFGVFLSWIAFRAMQVKSTSKFSPNFELSKPQLA
jgi:hypothetical protein